MTIFFPYPPGDRPGTLRGAAEMQRQKTYEQRLVERIEALRIRATLGARHAAGYLRNRGWSLEGSVAYLARQ